jgi:predicted metal-dependent phosphotriesterase family hydrolase
MEEDADLAGLIAYLARRGVPGERTYVCRMDTEPDDGLHRELAGGGALLGYRARAKDDDEAGAFDVLQRRLEDGHAATVAIGLELAEPSAWGGDRPGGGAGPAALVATVEGRLRDLGASDGDLDAMLGQNLLARAARPEGPSIAG